MRVWFAATPTVVLTAVLFGCAAPQPVELAKPTDKVQTAMAAIDVAINACAGVLAINPRASSTWHAVLQNGTWSASLTEGRNPSGPQVSIKASDGSHDQCDVIIVTCGDHCGR